MTAFQIMLVEDEPETARMVRFYLEHAGFSVATAQDGPSGEDGFRRDQPHLVILDLMLPGFDGLELCRRIRQQSTVPILMLTARTEDMDKAIGLGIGADDYLTKPFSPTELVANVSHDLRTPLTVIRGYLEGLHSGEIADRRSAEVAFEAMYGEVNRLLRLVDDLRQVASLETGPPQMNLRPGLLADLARDTVARIESVAAAKGMSLASLVPPDLPAVSFDSERMGEALLNLLDNAVRHTPHGGRIILRAGRAKYPNGPREHLWLSVEDTGEGIGPKHLPHIFERFYRADPARSRSEGGAGLGLSIAQAIVEAHGGRIVAQSDGIPGHSASFTIYLPL